MHNTWTHTKRPVTTLHEDKRHPSRMKEHWHEEKTVHSSQYEVPLTVPSWDTSTLPPRICGRSVSARQFFRHPSSHLRMKKTLNQPLGSPSLTSPGQTPHYLKSEQGREDGNRKYRRQPFHGGRPEKNSPACVTRALKMSPRCGRTSLIQ